MKRMFLLFATVWLSLPCLGQPMYAEPQGAFYRSDSSKKEIYLIFTGHDLDEGFPFVLKTLKEKGVQANFFLTGYFVKNHKGMVRQMDATGHFVGPHSDQHLLYCDWVKRDSLLVSDKVILKDYHKNLKRLKKPGVSTHLFMPPYEWYNRHVYELLQKEGAMLVNFSPGTSSNADYTTPSMPNYRGSREIYERILNYETQRGLNGFHLLIHPGTSSGRTDKLYYLLPDLIEKLRGRGYGFSRFRD